MDLPQLMALPRHGSGMARREADAGGRAERGRPVAQRISLIGAPHAALDIPFMDVDFEDCRGARSSNVQQSVLVGGAFAGRGPASIASWSRSIESSSRTTCRLRFGL